MLIALDITSAEDNVHSCQPFKWEDFIDISLSIAGSGTSTHCMERTSVTMQSADPAMGPRDCPSGDPLCLPSFPCELVLAPPSQDRTGRTEVHQETSAERKLATASGVGATLMA